MKVGSKVPKFIGFLVICTLLFTFQINQSSAAPAKKVIDILATPEKILFDIENFKPGDWATRTITIKNTGKEDFNYLTSADRKSGSKDLYEELILSIVDSSGEIFKGRLGDFKKLDPTEIPSGQQEELIFTVEFPTHLGNEYQGLTSEVEIKFYAEGTLGGVLPVDGQKLPETGTNTFNVLIAGIVLILGGGLLFFILKRRFFARH